MSEVTCRYAKVGCPFQVCDEIVNCCFLRDGFIAAMLYYGRTKETVLFYTHPIPLKSLPLISYHPVTFALRKEIHPTGQVGEAKNFSL